MNGAWHKISQNPYVHVLIAAFLTGAVPVLLPVIDGGNLSVSIVRVAIAAGIGAVGRAVILLVPTRPAKP